MNPRTYEVTFAGQAGPVLRAAFGDCQITADPGATTLRAELAGPAALTLLMERITGLGLQLIRVRLLAPPYPSGHNPG
jgi:hypothetical protein